MARPDTKYLNLRRTRAFSVVELLLATALMALMAGFTVLNLRGATGGADSRSLAMLVAETIRNARESALASQQPVAVLFPTDLGTTSFSQSLYLASGLSKAHVSRVYPFAREHAGAEVFVGTWTSGFSLFPALSAQANSQFNPDLWLTPSMKKDYALIFTPDGGASSNGIPFYQGAYQLVACAGGSASIATAPTGTPPFPMTALSYFQVQSLGKPWCIAISPSGQVRLTQGLAGAAAGLESTQSLGIANPATPPSASALPACNPSVQSLSLTPTPPSNPPGGVNTTVVAGQRLTLTLKAVDPSGRDLFTEWSCTPTNPACGPGSFSFPGKQRMTWDAAAQLWTSSWDWVAPLNAQPGDKFNFQATLGDGLTALVVPQTQPQILTIPHEELYGLINAGLVARCNRDGSNLTRLVTAAGGGLAIDVCPDGSKLISNNPIGWTIYSATTGALLASANPPGCAGSAAAISPRGNRVATWRLAGAQYQLETFDLDGGASQMVVPVSQNLIPGGFDGQSLRWSPDQSQLAFIASTTTGSEELWLVNADGSNLRRPLPAGVGATSLSWAPHGDYLYYKQYSNPNCDMKRYDVLNNQIDPGWTGSAASLYWPFALSSDGTQFLFRGGTLMSADITPTGTANNTTLLNPYPFAVGPSTLTVIKR